MCEGKAGPIEPRVGLRAALERHDAMFDCMAEAEFIKLHADMPPTTSLHVLMIPLMSLAVLMHHNS